MPAPDPDSLPPRWQAALRWGAPALTLAAMALLAWECLFNPGIKFLPPGPAGWIVYPLPPETEAYSGVELVGEFRTAFVLPEKPAAAALAWRCLDAGGIRVNNRIIPRPASPENWKTISHTDIASFLQQGSNEISVIVTNHLGPPALSLALEAGGVKVASDESWEVSVSGSTWRAAQSAVVTPKPGKGNELLLLESTSGAIQKCWPLLFLFAALSAGGVAVARCMIGRSDGLPKLFLPALAVIWTLLFLHNFPCTPAAAGFDGPDHLAYISYIQDHHRLPDAREGWEMFQPPLYYVLSAALLNLAHCRVSELPGLMLLRFFNLLIEAVNLVLVFIGLRLIFPGDWRKPMAGLVLAAFLPAQICLLHYTTNETLCAALVTAALCICLRLLREEKPHSGWCAALGVALGLGLMSKASAVLAVPAILGALALKLAMRRERSPRVWLEAIIAPLVVCLLVGGWHYFRLWREFGNPLIGNWDAKIAAPWWQYQGLHTAGDFFTFGAALTHPFYSGLQGFWDGIHSTLWGDGLLGGKINLWSRPPWNYDLMAIGFVLALFPAMLVLTGLARALAKCFRAATPVWLLLLGFGWIFAFAILHMSLKVPSYAQAKAFYGLPALLPFCALGALGFEYWTGRGKAARAVLGIGLGIWLLNLYASFWIRPHTAQSELSSAIAASLYLTPPRPEEFSNVLRQHPGDVGSTAWLASAEAKQHPDQAVQLLEGTVKHNASDSVLETCLAQNLALCNRLDEAVVHAKHAAELAPEDEAAARTWCSLALRQKNYEEAVSAARLALSINPSDSETRANLQTALRH